MLEYQIKYSQIHNSICNIIIRDDDKDENNFWLVSLQNSAFFSFNEMDLKILSFLNKIWIEFFDDETLVK